LEADAELGEVGDGGLEENDGALLALVGHDLDEGDARGVVNADVDKLPADAVVTVNETRRAPGDAMSHRADASEFLDIEVDQFAGMLALVAPYRPGWLQGRDPVEAEPSQDAADGRRRHGDLGGDLLGRVALSSQSLDRRARGRRRLARR
jgi:hypothetical protein